LTHIAGRPPGPSPGQPLHSAPCPPSSLARTLAFVNWTLPASLAVGSFGAVALLRLRTDATTGFLGFTALCAAGFGALAWLSDGALPVQLLALAAATGGVFAAMILGHWHLVTPKLSTGPALLMGRAMLGIVAFQLVLFVLWVGLGVGSAQAPLEPLTGPWALFVWLRLIVPLIFPLIVSWAAVETVKTRSMESATRLLYFNVALIAAGTIDAAGLYFGAGHLV